MSRRATTGLCRLRTLAWGLALLAINGGCDIRRNMFDQPKFEPYEATDFFGDGRSARPLVAGTVPRGFLREDEHLYDGRIDGELAATFPMPVTQELLARGQERFNIFCTPCHGQAGYGDGMVVQRGYKQPTSYHIDRMRQMPHGYFYDVIKNGFGVMPSYSYQVPRAEDRWAIVAYIRALQLSQHAELNALPEEDRLTIQGL
jgi:mono/diheme cytochrome c family protein